MQSTSKSSSWWIDILFLSLILGGLFFILLGNRLLFVPDEGRYAEIAREMIVSHDYITPYLNSVKYFEKPALFYWLESVAIYLGGLNLWSLRSVNVLLGLLGCILTYCTTRKLYDRTTGLFAALILGTNLLYFVMVHMISLDLPVTVFLTLTLYAFLLSTQEAHDFARRWLMWGAAIAAACAVMTKGLIGMVFPGMIIIVWLMLTGGWPQLKKLYLPSSILIFFLIAAPWHILVGQRNPEFYYFYFIRQHLLRYTMLKIGHYQPTWFFIPNLILGFFPWVVFLPLAIVKTFPRSWQQCKKNKNELFFILWATLIFIFFSFSKSKLIPYILPVFPPIAILVAHYLRQAILNKSKLEIKICYVSLLIFSTLISCALFIFPHKLAIPDPKTAGIYLGLAAIFLMIGIMIATYYAFKNYIKFAVISIIATAWIFLSFFHAALPAMDTRTIAPLTALLKPILTPEDEITAYNQYYQDLPFYLERRVNILNWKNELRLGMEYQDTSEWMIKDPIFLQRWNSQKRMFAIMSKEEYQKFQTKYLQRKAYWLGETLTNVLISNQPVHVRKPMNNAK